MKNRGIYRTVGSGTVTQANMKLSGVDGGATASGGAFVDFGAANVLTTKVGHLLKITDSAGKSIMGYIKAAGTGETLSDELITGWANHVANPVESFTLSGTDITQFINSAGGYGILYINKLVDMRLGLYKCSTDATINSGTFDYWGFGFGSAASAQRVVWTKPSVTGTYSGYITPNYTLSLAFINIMAGSTSALNAAFVNNTIKQVLTPSTTGVTIVSAKGGATYNWFNKNSAFNWNDASGYTYQIIQENGKHIYSSAITSGTLHLDASNTAMVFHDSIDLSPYAGTDAGSTPYLLCFYDSSGYMASAYAGAVGAGESLDSEFITAWKNSTEEPLAYETLTVNANGHDIDVADNNSTSGLAYTNIGVTIGKIYKIVADITLNSGTAPMLYTMRGTGKSINQEIKRVLTDSTTYWTSSAHPSTGTLDVGFGLYIINTAGNYSLLISAKKLTDVPVTGLHLFTTKNGSTRGMAYKHASFDPNTITSVKIYRAY